MTEEHGGFERARARLEQIAVEVRDKETPLEQCLDLLEEGVSVANRCTELLDHTEWRSVVETDEGEAAGEDAEPAPDADAEGSSEAVAEAAEADDVAAVDDEAVEDTPEDEPGRAPEDDDQDAGESGEAPQEVSDASDEADTDG